MYIPKHFILNEKEAVYKIIEDNSFATMFSQHDGRPFATHLPLTLDRTEEVLIGHVARQNPQLKDMQDQQVLAVFLGPHSYISPSWYETNTAVPTWNYTAVHVYGEAEMIESEQELMKSLRNLVDTYEKPDSSYELGKADPAYIKGLSKGIVGFKIKITRIEGKSKLSQNHPIKRRESVIEQLEQLKNENAQHIARLMKETIMNDRES